MPQIILKDRTRILELDFENLVVNGIIPLVAESLSCEDPGGALQPSEIEAECRETGPYSIQPCDLHITVIANTYPSRKKDIETRRSMLASNLGVLLHSNGHGPSIGLWIILVDGSFEAINL
jgi:hypothetical protein